MAEYPYTKTPVRVDQIHAEILASSFGVTKFQDVMYLPGTGALTVFTSSALLAGEETELDGIVSAHVPDSDYNPDEGFLRDEGQGTFSRHKSNLTATVDPTANDDCTQGYSINSAWVNHTNDRVWVCLDCTESGALWKTVTAVDATFTAHQETVSTPAVTTSSTFVQMPGMLWTPPSGTWRITFTGTVAHASKNKDTTVGLFSNGTQIGSYQATATTGESGNKSTVSIDRVIQVTGSQQIQVYWFAQAATPATESTVYDRSFIFIRIGD